MSHKCFKLHLILPPVLLSPLSHSIFTIKLLRIDGTEVQGISEWVVCIGVFEDGVVEGVPQLP